MHTHVDSLLDICEWRTMSEGKAIIYLLSTRISTSDSLFFKNSVAYDSGWPLKYFKLPDSSDRSTITKWKYNINNRVPNIIWSRRNFERRRRLCTLLAVRLCGAEATTGLHGEEDGNEKFKPSEMAFLQPIWRDTFWRFCHLPKYY